MTKYVAACIVLAVALFGLIQAQDLILGTIVSGDRVLQSQVYTAAGVPGGYVSRTASYSGAYNVTAVRAYDRTFNRTGQAHLLSGGLYQKNVSVQMTTRYPGNALDFLVEIYGR